LILTTSYDGSAFYTGRRSFGLVNFNGQTVVDTFYQGLNLSGAIGSLGVVQMVECTLGGVTNLFCIATRCQFQNPANAFALASSLVDCRALVGVGGAPVDFDFSALLLGNFAFRDFVGDIRLLNLANAAAQLELGMVAGRVELDATCTLGGIALSGTATLVDNSGPSCTVDITSLLPRAAADAVLQEVIADHETVSGSVAEALAVLRNRLRVNLTSQRLELYDAAGTVLLKEWPLLTTDGEDVQQFFGVQAERSSPL
jgi:hypothetical protein